MKKPILAIKYSRLNVHKAVREVMELADWKRFVVKDKPVSLKPNLGWDFLLPGAISSPWVVEGVIEVIKDYVPKIYMVESDQVLVKADKVLKMTGLDKVCERYKIDWVNMSKGKFKVIELDDAYVLNKAEIPEILTKTQIITLPLMKTHGKTTITGALKNQWGCLRKLRHNYHLVVNEALADINRIVKPVFAVMDGTVGLEGDGPKSGISKVVDLILASNDLVALDAVAAKVMGFDPKKIKHLQLCARKGIGSADLGKVDVRGEDISKHLHSFKPASHNMVSKVELFFRKSFLRPLIFKTNILDLMCFGAKVWYWIWENFGPGKERQKAILNHSYYGKQWQKG
jgi:uncharacterized protein (DUF362 family)